MTKDEEAKQYLASLQDPLEKNTPGTSLYKEDLNTEEYNNQIFKDNKKIIKDCNVILNERLESKDASLQAKDIINMKTEAFKQNQTILGLGEDEFDSKKLIPSVINIQVINNN